MFVTVTGGSGSGKSAFAERVIENFGEGKRIYIATMMCFDEESKKRVERHRRMRKDKHFETLECYTGLAEAEIPAGSHVLLECMSNLAANELFSPEGDREHTVETIRRGLLRLKERAEHVCVVTNEIFSDGMEYDPETGHYMEILGKINQILTEMSDVCCEVVYGIPLYLKKNVFEKKQED